MSQSTGAARRRAREWLPPVLWRARRALFGWRWFRGRFDSWREAQALAGGYDQPAILAKVLAATVAVQTGRAAYERDSVLFATPAADEPLLSALLRVAAEDRGRLELIDFGGSLGSVYWRHRKLLPHLDRLRWDIVEQAHFVDAGRREIERANEPLRFYRTIEEAEASAPHNALLAAGVVHYLPDPHRFLAELVARRFDHLIFHNVPLHDGDADHVRVQHVPPTIYDASYPVWFFNRDKFLRHFADDYEVVREYASEAVWPLGWHDYPSTGLLLRRKGRR